MPTQDSSPPPKHVVPGHVPDCSVTRNMLSALMLSELRLCVLIADRDLNLVALNPVVCEEIGGHADQPPPTLSDLLPPSVRVERLAVARECLDSDRSVEMRGMLGGRWRDALHRPYTNERASRCLMIVCTAVTDADPVLVARDVEQRRANTHDLGRLGALTERELEVLRYIGHGLSSREIAEEIHRSVKTVNSHRHSIGQKLDVRRRVELARIAVDSGLVYLTPEEIRSLGVRSGAQPGGV